MVCSTLKSLGHEPGERTLRVSLGNYTGNAARAGSSSRSKWSSIFLLLLYNNAYGPCGAVLFVPGEQQQRLCEKFRVTVTKLTHSLSVKFLCTHTVAAILYRMPLFTPRLAIALATTGAVVAVSALVLLRRRRRAYSRAALTCEPLAALPTAVEQLQLVAENTAAPSPQALADIQAVRSDLARQAREARRANDRRVWERARARADAVAARAEEERATGLESLAERSRRLIDERRRREAEEAKENEDEARTTPTAKDADGTRAAPNCTSSSAESLAAELCRWPAPPAGVSVALEEHAWPLYYDHYAWVDEIALKYAFHDSGEVLRHLVFVANLETPAVKKCMFLSIRCLHCHAGAGSAGEGIPKRSKVLALFGFQHRWLLAVQQRSGHPTVEKTVRIICDYYRKLTSDRPGAEAELFWRNRLDVTAPRGGRA